MACNLTSAIALDCIDSLGGVKTMYVGANIVISSTSYDVDNQITGLTGTGTFYQYELAKNTASYTETVNVSDANGTLFASQALTFNIQKMEAAKRNELLLLSRNRDIKIIFVDNNDNIWLLGKERGATITAASAVTGTASGDANQYVMTATAEEPAMAYQIDSLSSLSGFTITNA